MQSAPKAYTLSMWLPTPVMKAATKPATKPAATKPAATKPVITSSVWMKDEPSVVVAPCFYSKEELEWQAKMDRRYNFYGRDFS